MSLRISLSHKWYGEPSPVSLFVIASLPSTGVAITYSITHIFFFSFLHLYPHLCIYLFSLHFSPHLYLYFCLLPKTKTKNQKLLKPNTNDQQPNVIAYIPISEVVRRTVPCIPLCHCEERSDAAVSYFITRIFAFIPTFFFFSPHH